MAEKLGPVFHVSRIGVSSEFGGDTYTLKLHCHDRDQAETLKRRLLEEKLMPGPFPAQFAEQAESIETGKLAQAMSWLGLSAPSGEMLSWWVGREVNRLLDAVLEQREEMRDVQQKARAWDALYEQVRDYEVESARRQRLDEMAKVLASTRIAGVASDRVTLQHCVCGAILPKLREGETRLKCKKCGQEHDAGSAVGNGVQNTDGDQHG